MRNNLVLVSDIREWLLTRKIIDHMGTDFGAIDIDIDNRCSNCVILNLPMKC